MFKVQTNIWLPTGGRTPAVQPTLALATWILWLPYNDHDDPIIWWMDVWINRLARIWAPWSHPIRLQSWSSINCSGSVGFCVLGTQHTWGSNDHSTDKWNCPCGRLLTSSFSSASSPLLALQVQIHPEMDCFLLLLVTNCSLLGRIPMCSGASVEAHCISFWCKPNWVIESEGYLI